MSKASAVNQDLGNEYVGSNPTPSHKGNPIDNKRIMMPQLDTITFINSDCFVYFYFIFIYTIKFLKNVVGNNNCCI